MNSGSELLFPSDESDIAEESPDGRYVRYNEVLYGWGTSKVAYKGFDEFGGMEVTWNKVSVEDPFKSEEEYIEEALDKLLKPLKHENITKYYSSWADHETESINVITESFTSGTLRQYRQKHRGVDLVAIKNWGRQILQGLCYLHGHDPPIVHGKLMCDNIFINGNAGEVKIGLALDHYFGLQEYNNENVDDVHWFGMCILELVTSEYPYSECKTPAEMYKKIKSGMKPAALAKVKDTQVKQFIEKCLLLPVASVRLMSVMQLLEDPFLQLPAASPLCLNETPMIQVFELIRRTSVDHHHREFRLKGETNDESKISLRLRIDDNLCGRVTNIDFVFDLDVDTTLSVAGEMIEELALSDEDATLIAELMDTLIIKLVPYWIPSVVKFSGVKCSYGDLVLAF